MKTDTNYYAAIAAGFAIIIFGIVLGGNIFGFVDSVSVVVVIGGMTASLFVGYEVDILKSIPVYIQKAGTIEEFEHIQLIRTIVNIADKVRKEGILALDQVIPNLEEPILAQGLQLVVDGIETKIIDNILTTNIRNIEKRHAENAEIFEFLGDLGPAFGMIGTLIGLVNMLGQLSDPSSLGPAMAVAMITTFYGSVVANLIMIPTCKRLNLKSSRELQYKGMAVQGLLMIGDGFHPRMIQEKLLAYMKDEARESFDEEDDDI